MDSSIIEDCWSAHSKKEARFCSVILATSVCGASLEEVGELTTDEIRDRTSQALLEWEVVGTREAAGKCICSLDIAQQHVLVNKLNGGALAVGQECIKKYGTDEQKLYLSIHTNHKKYTGERKACCYCGSRKISADHASATPLCKSCRESGCTQASSAYLNAVGQKCRTCKTGRAIPGSLVKSCLACCKTRCKLCQCMHNSRGQHCPYCSEILQSWRVCSGCNKPNISVQEEDWKTRCRDCYSSNKPVVPVKVQMRKCNTCSLDAIPITEPDWKKTCRSCWSASVAPKQTNEERFCVSCKKVKIDACEPAYKTKCHWCFKKEMEGGDRGITIRSCSKCGCVLHSTSRANYQLCATCSPPVRR